MNSFEFSLAGAQKASQEGTLAEWIQEFLQGEGGNITLAEGMLSRPLYLVGIIEFPLSELRRICGPEEGQPFLEESVIWEAKVGKLVEAIRNGYEPLPLFVSRFYGTDFAINDGNHRYEALKRLGVESYWTIFWAHDLRLHARYQALSS